MEVEVRLHQDIVPRIKQRKVLLELVVHLVKGQVKLTEVYGDTVLLAVAAAGMVEVAILVIPIPIPKNWFAVTAAVPAI